MTDIRIEFSKADFCKSCGEALNDLQQVAEELKVPVRVEKSADVGIVYPLTCVISNKNGKKHKECIQGYNSDYADDVRSIIESMM